jgi:hypothetical protein
LCECHSCAQVFVLGGSWSGGKGGGRYGEVFDGNAWRALTAMGTEPMQTADFRGIYRQDNHGRAPARLPLVHVHPTACFRRAVAPPTAGVRPPATPAACLAPCGLVLQAALLTRSSCAAC